MGNFYRYKKKYHLAYTDKRKKVKLKKLEGRDVRGRDQNDSDASSEEEEEKEEMQGGKLHGPNNKPYQEQQDSDEESEWKPIEGGIFEGVNDAFEMARVPEVKLHDPGNRAPMPFTEYQQQQVYNGFEDLEKIPKIPIFDFNAVNIYGSSVPLWDYTDKILLFVNMARDRNAGMQIQKLNALLARNQHRNFDILGFPCDVRGGDIGTNEQCLKMFRKQLGAQFQLFEVTDVNGDDALWSFLRKSRKNYEGYEKITWNWTKFLVDHNGNCRFRLLDDAGQFEEELMELMMERDREKPYKIKQYDPKLIKKAKKHDPKKQKQIQLFINQLFS